tara:strand:+ start:517 stop:2787 length:2271 start_codon:yes stop_codon:yes gene_type:complete
MNKQLSLFLLAISLSQFGCEEEISTEASNNQTSLRNTLNEDLPGASGSISDYFYNFEDEINANFFRYDPSLMAGYNTYLEYYNQRGETPPEMEFKTFNNYLLSMTPSDKNEFTRRYSIDSLSVKDSIVSDSLLMVSTSFKNLEKLEWDLLADPSLQRYKLVNSDWIQADTTLYYSDTFDVSAYRAVVDTPFIDQGLLFVDSSEWLDTNYVFLNDNQIRFVSNFEFEKQELSADSLVFRINTDCNDNGTWDEGETTLTDFNGDGKYEALYEYKDNNNNGEYDEGDSLIQDYDGNDIISIAYEFIDRGNGIWDRAEPYYDINADQVYNISEPYQDRNCNQIWDNAEPRVNSASDCDGIGNYLVDTDGGFCDRGNKIFDLEEEYTMKDSDGDGTSEKYLYLIGDKPNNLIVDYTDTEDPKVLLEVEVGDDIIDRWGNEYNNLIGTVDFNDLKQQYVDDIDSLVTLYTRKKIGHINGSSISADDYYITKSEWYRKSGSTIERNYNYHIFHEPNHLNQVVYPSYFLPVGFYFAPKEIQNGFWHKPDLQSEVLYYTSGGNLRDGEQVDTAYYDTTGIAVYYIQKSYNVESDTVTVPAARISFNATDDGNYQCLATDEIVNNSEECPPADTTFTECFKVTQITTMTMIGTGVEYGERTESWLVKNKGLVKSEIHIRWTENPYNEDFTDNGEPDENNEAWVGLNRIELTSIDKIESAGVFRKLTHPVNTIELRDIGNHPDFDYEPLRISAQKGIQTLDLMELNQ